MNRGQIGSRRGADSPTENRAVHQGVAPRLEFLKDQTDQAVWYKRSLCRKLDVMRSEVPSFTNTGRLSKFLPTFGEIILLLPLCMVLAQPIGLSFLLKDGDTGLHIRTGEWILANGEIPTTDLYSFTRPNQEWFAWEWLWDVLFGALHSVWGLSAVALASLFVLSAAFYRAYNTANQRSGNSLFAFAVTGLCLICSWQHWLARPHLVTLLFVAITIWWIEKNRESSRKMILPLAVLTALWANLHGGFIMICIILGAYACGAFLRGLGQPERDRRNAHKKAIVYLTGGLLCLLAGTLNPYGTELYKHLFLYLSDPLITERTLEFKPPALSHIWMMMLFSLDVLSTAWFIYKEEYESALLVAGTAGMALTAIRHVALHCVIVAPFLCEAATELARTGGRLLPQRPLREFLEDLDATGREWGGQKRTWATLSLPAVLIAATILLSTTGRFTRFRGRFQNGDFPVAAVATLNPSSRELRIFSDDEVGDYLVYALFPKVRVFWDGRMDFYGSGILREYDVINSGAPGWQNGLEKFNVNTAVLRKAQPLSNMMRAHQTWQESYEDTNYVVFTRNSQSKE